MITKNIELKDINTEILDRLPGLLGCDEKEILFIDIETTGLSPKDSEIYMIGAAFCDGAGWQIRQLFAEDPSREEEVLSAFSDFCRHYKVLLHYNGDRFDIPFLQNNNKEESTSAIPGMSRAIIASSRYSASSGVSNITLLLTE